VGFLKTRQAKRRILLFVRTSMTRYASARDLPNKKASTVAAAFKEEILLRHGCPFEIVTDQGSEFREEFEKLLKTKGLKQVQIRPTNLKANGQVEHFMQILKSTLTIKCNDEPRDWQRHVSSVIFQYNVRYQETI
jgi:transposase InsO family protein